MIIRTVRITYEMRCVKHLLRVVPSIIPKLLKITKREISHDDVILSHAGKRMAFELFF